MSLPTLSTCGFGQAVPHAPVMQYTMSLFRPPARCTLVETALTLRSEKGFVGHFATYEVMERAAAAYGSGPCSALCQPAASASALQSAIFGFASASELRKLRKQAEEVRMECGGRVLAAATAAALCATAARQPHTPARLQSPPLVQCRPSEAWARHIERARAQAAAADGCSV